MADSIRELIMKDIKSTLESIDTADGYNYTMSERTVRRFNMRGQNFVDLPTYVIDMTQETEIPMISPKEKMRMSITISAYYVQKEDDDLDTGVYINMMLADIKKSLLVDPQRGTYAIETVITGADKFNTTDEQKYTGIIVGIDVQYQHAYGDPYTK